MLRIISVQWDYSLLYLISAFWWPFSDNSSCALFRAPGWQLWGLENIYIFSYVILFYKTVAGNKGGNHATFKRRRPFFPWQSQQQPEQQYIKHAVREQVLSRGQKICILPQRHPAILLQWQTVYGSGCKKCEDQRNFPEYLINYFRHHFWDVGLLFIPA